MALTKFGYFLAAGGGKNGAVIDGWLASRFAGVPAEDSSPPGGAPDAGPVTSAITFGGPGAYELTMPSAADYYIRSQYGNHAYWSFCPAGSIGGQSGGGGGGGGGFPSTGPNFVSGIHADHGITDNQPVIQAAINAAVVAGAGEVWIPWFSSAIGLGQDLVVPAGLKLKGSGVDEEKASGNLGVGALNGTAFCATNAGVGNGYAQGLIVLGGDTAQLEGLSILGPLTNGSGVTQAMTLPNICIGMVGIVESTTLTHGTSSGGTLAVNALCPALAVGSILSVADATNKSQNFTTTLAYAGGAGNVTIAPANVTIATGSGYACTIAAPAWRMRDVFISGGMIGVWGNNGQCQDGNADGVVIKASAVNGMVTHIANGVQTKVTSLVLDSTAGLIPGMVCIRFNSITNSPAAQVLAVPDSTHVTLATTVTAANNDVFGFYAGVGMALETSDCLISKLRTLQCVYMCLGGNTQHDHCHFSTPGSGGSFTTSTTLTNGVSSGTSLVVSSTAPQIPALGTITVTDGSGGTQTFSVPTQYAGGAGTVTITAQTVTLATVTGGTCSAGTSYNHVHRPGQGSTYSATTWDCGDGNTAGLCQLLAGDLTISGSSRFQNGGNGSSFPAILKQGLSGGNQSINLSAINVPYLNNPGPFTALIQYLNGSNGAFDTVSGITADSGVFPTAGSFSALYAGSIPAASSGVVVGGTVQPNIGVVNTNTITTATPGTTATQPLAGGDTHNTVTVTTSITGTWSLNIGPTSSPTQAVAGGSTPGPVAGSVFSFDLPAGWFYQFAWSAGAVSVATQVL